MVRSRRQTDQDRYLILSRGLYHYKRRVPTPLVEFDKRAPHVRVSLKTSDLVVARQKRDVLEQADNELWTALYDNDNADSATTRYRAAVARVKALNFIYKPASEVAAAPVGEILARLESVDRDNVPREISRAVIGVENDPGRVHVAGLPIAGAATGRARSN
jgi:hypothetical protein